MCLGGEGNGEGHDAAHLLLQQRLYARSFILGALDDQLVVHLHDELRGEPLVREPPLDAHHCELHQIRRRALNGHVQRHALAEGADAIAHGCTGKGNDQVRFELGIQYFAPGMTIIAPWREWEIKSRDEEIDYAEAHHVPLKISRETNYSKDKNLWHLSHEGLDLEDPANEPDLDKDKFLEMSVSPYKAPDVATEISVDFEAGVPVAVNGEKMKVSKIIAKLNELGGANGIGILDIVENRLIGMKDHGIYETPGGTILYFAHEQLEMLTLDKETAHMKSKLAVDYADLIYNGKWFSPLAEALTAFAKKANENCTGTVKLKLYKGNMINAGITSPNSLYSEELVTFGESDFDQAQAAGFINIWGLPTKVQSLLKSGKL